MNPARAVSGFVSLRLVGCILLTQWGPCVLGQSALEQLLHSTIPVFAASAVDGAGNVYVAGYTTQDVISTTPGAFQRQFVAGSCSDGINGKCAHSFVIKISSDGTSVLYATYLGGGRSDIIRTITIDSSGGAYVTGSTTSPDFPVSPAANQRSPGPGFIARISRDGSTLLASTYVSGEPWNLVLDAAGNVYAAGVARTAAFTTTAGAFQITPQGGMDAFALKMDGGLSTVVYSTLLGGSLDDYASALAVDSQGNAYVGGFTASKIGGSVERPFPVTTGAYVGPGGAGAFVSEINPDGSKLIFAAILGDGFSHGIVLDSSKNVYIGGGTNGGPSSTPGASLGSGSFAAKLSTDGAHLIYETQLPGYPSVISQLYSVNLIEGDHFLVWDSTMQQVPTTVDSSHPCTTEGTMASYMLELNSSGSDRVYGTYLPNVIAVTDAGVWSVSQDPTKLLDRMPLHGFGTQGMTCVSSAATFYSGPIAPGEFVAIFGIDIGPDQPAFLQLDQNGKVGTSLGGVSVFFNGVAAPLSYVSRNQINAVVPFEIASWPSSYVTILKGGVVLPELNIPVTPTSLSFFRIGNEYAVVNQNGTLNGQFSPAPKQSIITIYVTGAGVMRPPVATGSLGDGTSSIAEHLTAIFSILDGFNSTDTTLSLLYAGDAPTLVQGVVVLQVSIPDTALPGPASLRFLSGDDPASIRSTGLRIWVK